MSEGGDGKFKIRPVFAMAVDMQSEKNLSLKTSLALSESLFIGRYVDFITDTMGNIESVELMTGDFNNTDEGFIIRRIKP